MEELTKELCLREIEKNGYMRIGPFLVDQYSDGTWYAVGQDYETAEQAIDAFIEIVNNASR